ncbi:hypothetical protein FOF52_15800 [Thermobifida alba]|uniref:Uncharacterized protein n=1 Tax=Thermobifida alba TaxID=53522 RepID=A0ABY4L828_THEAE|nr:hypothetical protein [Thermobifida alba]UPT22247.1 hypothetical protein FOF52_15800 [Thermobifida alba]
MADYTLTPDQLALLADGRARVEEHEHGLAVVLGADRLILPIGDPVRTVTALANLDTVLGTALSTAMLWGR